MKEFTESHSSFAFVSAAFRFQTRNGGLPAIVLQSPAMVGGRKIIGAEQTEDGSSMKPILTVEMQAGRPVVLWKKQGMDGVEIWVDRSDGKGFVFLATDTQPDYIDTAPLPAARSALWKYKAIYLQAGERVGQWSDVVSIALAGWFFSQLNFPPNPCKSSPLNQSKK